MLIHVLVVGAVAQLGERLNGIQEAVSSILSSSTRNFLRLMRCMGLFYFLAVALFPMQNLEL